MRMKKQNFDFSRVKDLLFFCLTGFYNHLFIVSTIFLIIGIIAGNLKLSFLFTGAIVPLVLAAISRQKKLFISVLCCLLFFLLGHILFTNYTQRILRKTEFIELFENNKVDSLIGVVVGDSVWNKINASNNVVKQTFPFKVEKALLTNGESVEILGKVNVVWLNGAYDIDNMPTYGNRLRIGGLYCYNSKLVGRGMDKYVFKVSARSWKSSVLDEYVFGSGWLKFLHNYKSFCFMVRRESLPIFDLGLKKHPDASGVLKSIIVGRRVFLNPKLKEGLINTGTIHIIAVSGLHAGIVAGIIILVLKLFGCPRYRWFYILAPILVTYTFYTGARPSAVRACLMLLIYYLSYVINRKSSILYTVSISAFLILIFNPIQLFDLGFIFSFVTVLGLILLFPPVYSLVKFSKKVDEEDFIPEPKSEETLKQKFISAVSVMFVVSVVAWLISMPLTIHFFNRIVFLAPIVNVLVVPLTFCLILLGILSLASACIVGFMPYIFNILSMMVVKLLELVIFSFSSCKYAKIENVDLNNFEFLLYIPLIAVVVLSKIISKQNHPDQQVHQDDTFE